MVEVDFLIDENGKVTMIVVSSKGEDPACLVAATIKKALSTKGVAFQDERQNAG